MSVKKLDTAFLKRSAKLLPCQKEMAVWWRQRGAKFVDIAAMFKVSPKTIEFICHPERQQKNLEKRKINGGEMRYYDKEKHRKSQERWRNFSKSIHNNTD
jgi:hypothetical protein